MPTGRGVRMSSAMVLLLASAPAVFGQAQRWVMPPNVVDFSTGTPTVNPLPGAPAAPYEAANGIYDAAGNLLFFVAEPAGSTSFLRVYDSTGTLIDNLKTSDFNHEIAIIPFPGDCHRYYIVYFHSRGFIGTDLYYSVVDVQQNKILQKDVLAASYSGNRGALAVTRLRPDATRFLYAISFPKVDKFLVDPTGIKLVSTLLDATASGSPLTSLDFNSPEADLSDGGDKLAWSGAFGGNRILVVKLNSNGDFASLSTYPFGPAAGLEFSPGGNKLFLADGTALSSLDLSSGVQSPLGGSNGYGNSLLETASDGRIYAAAAGNLGAIDPGLLSFTPAAVPGVNAGSLASSPLGGSRTLPEQIDGEILQGCAECFPPPAGLAAWWPFDEIAGNQALDVSGNSNTGLHHNTSPDTGRVGDSLDFNGTYSYVGVPHSPSLALTGSFSLDFWIHPEPGESSGTIFRKGVPLPSNPLFLTSPGFHLAYAQSGHFTGIFSSPAASFQTDLSPAFTGHALPGVWTFVAVTVDLPGKTVSLYINGSLVRVTTLPASLASLTNSEPVVIGGSDVSPSALSSFDGRLDELEVFDRALSASEVQAIFEAGVIGKCKEVCHTTWEAACTSPGTGTADVTICNNSTAIHSFAWSLTSVAAIPNSVCSVNGPSLFSPLSGTEVLIPGECSTSAVQIQCPAGQPVEAHGCFELNVQNLETGAGFSCSGSSLIGKKWLWKPRRLVYDVPAAAQPVPVVFEVTHLGDTTETLDFRLMALPSDMSSRNTAVSLNGNPPEATLSGSITAGPGETREVRVNASFLEHLPFTFYDLLVVADFDGDGVAQKVASAGLRSTPMDCNGNGIADDMDLALGTSQDCTGNGIPDECDIARNASPDCNRNTVPDFCEIGSGTAPDVNGNGVPDSCDIRSVTWLLTGTAQGGTVSATIQGLTATCTVTITTLAGESAVTVASRLAEALNADSCLASQGITASVRDGRVSIHGLVEITNTISDPGLGYVVDVPALSAWGILLLIVLLLTAAALRLRRLPE